MAMVPLAALSVGSYNLSLKDLTFKKLIKAWKRFADTANYAEILPPLGSQQLSYAKFLELLSHRQIKRIILMDNATCAIVEVRGFSSSWPGILILCDSNQSIAMHISAVMAEIHEFRGPFPIYQETSACNTRPSTLLPDLQMLQVPVEGYAASYRYPLSVDRIDET